MGNIDDVILGRLYFAMRKIMFDLKNHFCSASQVQPLCQEVEFSSSNTCSAKQLMISCRTKQLNCKLTQLNNKEERAKLCDNIDIANCSDNDNSGDIHLAFMFNLFTWLLCLTIHLAFMFKLEWRKRF